VADLDEEKSQIAHGETVRETANMISFLTEAIGIRDDKFLGAGHTGMVEVAEAVQTGFEEGTLHQRPTLVNLQCDLDHPTQSLSDLSMLVDTFGSLENLKGKKLAMTWAYSPSYGKPLSVPQGVIGLMTRFGMEVTLAYPEGYDLVPEIMDRARTQAQESGGTFTVTHDMDAAFQEADVVYPKSWAPFTIMQERTRLLRAGDTRGLDALETQALAQNAEHQDWECTEEKMALTHNGKALYMHCLPADISGVSCKQGEVAATVFNRYRKATYQQASYKPFIIAAMIVLGRFPDPVAKITDVVGRSQLRY
jgi:knotted carbamoyltransferase YgeW